MIPSVSGVRGIVLLFSADIVFVLVGRKKSLSGISVKTCMSVIEAYIRIVTDYLLDGGEVSAPGDKVVLCIEKLGIHPDIWIDDSPGSIDQFGTLQPCDNQLL